MSQVIDLDLHRKVWMTCKEVCRACGHAEICKVHIEADLDRLECSGCHEMTSAVTHLDIDPDGPEYVWHTRMELARDSSTAKQIEGCMDSTPGKGGPG